MEARLTELQETITKMGASLTRSMDGMMVMPTRRTRNESSDFGAAGRISGIRTALLANGAGINSSLLAVDPSFLVTRSQRNPTPLFGLGLIDAIPDRAIEAMEARQAEVSPEIKGSVSRVKDGRIGRLGWKGQVASVEDFVLNACAVELGLEVPGHHQAMTPQAPEYRTSGLDLTSEECSVLVAYVNSLPKPVERKPVGDRGGQSIDAGRATFASIGCARCHSPRLGDVQGIYSDLLLHDMGPELADEGSYTDGSSDDGPIVRPRRRTWPPRPKSSSAPSLLLGSRCNGNGERRRFGACATRHRISTTAAPRLSSKPWPCMADRERLRRRSSWNLRRANVSKSRLCSSH